MARKKGLNKSKVGFSVDIEVIEELEKYCDVNFLTKSKVVNELLKRFLDSKKYKQHG